MINYKELFYDNNKLNKNKLKEEWVKKNYNLLYIEVYNFKENIKIEVERFSQLMWHYDNNMIDYPFCDYCGKYNKRFNGVENGYKNGCGRSCAIQLTRPASNKTRRSNTLKKYGVEHTSQLKSTMNKKKKTTLERYGVEHATQNSDVMHRIKKTNLERYGSELPLQSDKIKNKMISNFIEKWGVDNPSKDDNIKKIKVENSLLKWGTKYHITTDEVKSKSKNTNDIKFFAKIQKIYDCNNFELISYENSIIKLKCLKCDEYSDISSSLMYQRYTKHKIDVCLKCNPLNNKNSKGHIELVDFLKELGIKNIIINDRNVIKPLEIDIYLPDYKMGIEYNGVYWHSELFKNKDYHINKYTESKKNGISLIQIWEDSWINKKEIIKSIIKHRLNLSDNKIGARKCVIKNVNVKDTSEFLTENHLQGYSVSKYRYGLYYNDELLSIATFGKGRKNVGGKSDEYEIIRMSVKKDINIVGGFAKLFNHFMNENKPDRVISYSDNDYFTGSIYNNFNMIVEKDIIPSYTWGNGVGRWNRWNFRKDKLIKEGFDSNKTEVEIMLERGFYRCFSSGQKKWVYDRIKTLTNI